MTAFVTVRVDTLREARVSTHRKVEILRCAQDDRRAARGEILHCAQDDRRVASGKVLVLSCGETLCFAQDDRRAANTVVHLRKGG